MKSKKMKIVAAVMVLSMLTTCMISGTLAKYTTGDSVMDSARVAKWGVEVQAAGYLYGNTYGSDNQVVFADTSNNEISIQSVNSATDVVAPGSFNDDGIRFALKGEPEVAGEIKSTIKAKNVFLKAGHYGIMIPMGENVITSDNYQEYVASDNLYVFREGSGYNKSINQFEEDASYFMLQNEFVLSKNYYPVVYTLNGATSSNNTNIDRDSLKEVSDLIASQLGMELPTDSVMGMYTYDGTKSFIPNSNLADSAGINLGNQVLTWKWSFENGSNDEEKEMYNAADTFLGLIKGSTNGIAVKYKESAREYKTLQEYVDYNLETQFDINITVTQTD